MPIMTLATDRRHMKTLVVLTAFLVLLALVCGMPGARADELVQVAPHRTAIWPAGSDTTPPLLGLLARPAGPGRSPAVVLLHSCGGFSAHDTEAAATLKT